MKTRITSLESPKDSSGWKVIWKFTRSGFLAALGLILLTATTAVQAVVITEDLLFQTTNQNMWAPGAPAVINGEIFLGTDWGVYNPPSLECNYQPCPPATFNFGTIGGGYGCFLGICADTTTGAQAKVETSGKVGVNAGVNLSGGTVAITVPVQATLTVPDQISAGQFFTLSTATATQTAGATISTTAPSAEMYINGVFDTQNAFYGRACLAGECAGNLATPLFNADFTPDPFPIIGFKTQDNPLSIFGATIPGIPFESVAKYPIYKPPSIKECYLGDNFLCFPKPTQLGEISLDAPLDHSGGVVAGDHLTLFTQQPDVLNASLSLSGIVEAIYNPTGVGILKNSLTLLDGPGPVDLNLSYTLFDVSLGPQFGLQQQFDLAVKPAVALQFDRPVVRMELVKIGTTCKGLVVLGTCIGFTEPVYALQPVTHEDGFIEILLGDNANLMFEDGIGELLDYKYLLSDPMFSNKTAMTSRLTGTIKAACITVLGLIDNECLLKEDFLSVAFPNRSVFDKAWNIGGFNSITGTKLALFNTPEQPSVPEPGTLFLILVGIFGIVFSAQRRPRCRIIHAKTFV